MSSLTPSSHELIACHECDLLQRTVALAPGAAARCARCEAVLMRRARYGFDHSLPLFVAAAVLLVLANVFPIISLRLQGDQNDATLLQAARVLFREHRPDVALLILVTGVLAPALQIGAALYLLIALRLRRVPRGFKGAFRLFRESAPWAMVEVFALGVLVSMVKLAHVATVVPGVALWSFGVLMVVLAVAVNSVDPREVWARAEALR
jgi:paraquat-inducible protein A